MFMIWNAEHDIDCFGLRIRVPVPIQFECYETYEAIKSNQEKRQKIDLKYIDDLECIFKLATNWFWALEMAPRNTIRRIDAMYTSKFISQNVFCDGNAHQYENDRSFYKDFGFFSSCFFFFIDSILINLCILCALCSLKAWADCSCFFSLGWLWYVQHSIFLFWVQPTAQWHRHEQNTLYSYFTHSLTRSRQYDDGTFIESGIVEIFHEFEHQSSDERYVSQNPDNLMRYTHICGKSTMMIHTALHSAHTHSHAIN